MQNLPHHKLLAYGVAVELLRAVRESRIRDAYLRDHAMRAAKSACLNTAEGAGRVTRAEKALSFTIARGEHARRRRASRSRSKPAMQTPPRSKPSWPAPIASSR